MVVKREEYLTWASELEIGDQLVFGSRILTVDKIAVHEEGWPKDNPRYEVFTTEKKEYPLFYRANSEVTLRRYPE